jgi:6-pyruvoyltetrahydropterin/6-carboxytetrahydropterin synthase
MEKIKMKWSINKSFSFEAGHRVWSQKLEHEELSISTNCYCKNLHGHSYEVKVFLSADELDYSNMVTDFRNLEFFKKFLDDVLDHKFLIDINDPNFDIITGCEPIKLENFNNFTNLNTIVSSTDDRILLHRGSFVLVDFVPTSENICKYLKIYAASKIGHLAEVEAVELWETKKSHCRYTG